MPRRHPDWIKVKAPGNPNYLRLKRLMREKNLHTVCEEARCPNIGECWGNKTATFLILGDTCTRGCRFCAIDKGKPLALDPEEPRNVGLVVKDLGLDHIVVTSVNRDDLPDGGAAHFAKTVFWIKSLNPGIRVELLIPDFEGNLQALETVVNSGIEILNHNIETVPRLYGKVRPGHTYECSLNILKEAKKLRGVMLTKSGFMVGVGETAEEDHDHAARFAEQRRRHRHHRPISAAFRSPTQSRTLRNAGRVSAIQSGGRQIGLSPRRVRPTGAQLLSRLEPCRLNEQAEL